MTETLICLFLICIIIYNLCKSYNIKGGNIEENLKIKVFKDILKDTNNGTWLNINSDTINTEKVIQKQQMEDVTILFKKDSNSFFNINIPYDKYKITNILNNIFINDKDNTGIKNRFELNLKNCISKLYEEVDLKIDNNTLKIENVELVNDNNNLHKIGLKYNYSFDLIHTLNETKYKLSKQKLKKLFDYNIIKYIKNKYLNDILDITNSDYSNINNNDINSVQFRYSIKPTYSGTFIKNSIILNKLDIKSFIKKYFEKELYIINDEDDFVLENGDKQLKINITFSKIPGQNPVEKFDKFTKTLFNKNFTSALTGKSIVLYDFIEHPGIQIEYYLKNIYVPNEYHYKPIPKIIESIRMYNLNDVNIMKTISSEQINPIKTGNKYIIKLPKLQSEQSINIDLIFKLHKDHKFANQESNKLNITDYSPKQFELEFNQNRTQYELQFYDSMYEYKYTGGEGCNTNTTLLRRLNCYDNTIRILKEPIFFNTNYQEHIESFYSPVLIRNTPSNLTQGVLTRNFKHHSTCNKLDIFYNDTTLNGKLKVINSIELDSDLKQEVIATLFSKMATDEIFFSFIENKNPIDKVKFLKLRILGLCKNDLIKNNKFSETDIKNLSETKHINKDKIYGALRYLESSSDNIIYKYKEELSRIPLDTTEKTFENFRFMEPIEKLSFLEELNNSIAVNQDVKFLIAVQIHIYNDKYNNKLSDYKNVNKAEISELYKLINSKANNNFAKNFKARYIDEVINQLLNKDARINNFMEYMSSELDKNFGTENKCIKIFENKSNLDDSKLFEELKLNNCIDDRFFTKIRTEKENEIYKSSLVTLQKNIKKLTTIIEKNRITLGGSIISEEHISNLYSTVRPIISQEYIQNTVSTLSPIISEESRPLIMPVKYTDIVSQNNCPSVPLKLNKIVDMTDVDLYITNPNTSNNTLISIFGNSEDSNIKKTIDNIRKISNINLDFINNINTLTLSNMSELNNIVSKLDQIKKFTNILNNSNTTIEQKQYLQVYEYIINTLIRDLESFKTISIKLINNKKSFVGGNIDLKNPNSPETILTYMSKNIDKKSIKQVFSIIYSFVRNDRDDFNPSNPIDNPKKFFEYTNIIYNNIKNNREKLQEFFIFLEKNHSNEFKKYKNIVNIEDKSISDIYMNLNREIVSTSSPIDNTIVPNKDILRLSKRNQDLEKKIQEFKTQSDNYKIKLDNCNNTISIMNRAAQIASYRGGKSNISMVDKNKNQKRDIEQQSKYMSKNINNQDLSKPLKTDNNECNTFSCQSNEKIQKQYQNTLDLLNLDNSTKKMSKKCRPNNQECDMCGVIKNTSNYDNINQLSNIISSEDIDYDLPLCPPDCSKCDDINNLQSYDNAFNSNLLKDLNKNYNIDEVKFYKDDASNLYSTYHKSVLNKTNKTIPKKNKTQLKNTDKKVLKNKLNKLVSKIN